MKIFRAMNPHLNFSISLLVVCLLSGEYATAKPSMPVANDVKVSEPDVSTGSTHELRAEGPCDFAVLDRQHPLEFELTGRMSYRVRISNGPFVKDRWHINPLVDVTNSGDRPLYLGYYAAFFDTTGRLVGCCGQQLEAEPSERPMQLASLVVEGRKAKLQAATHFKIVIYESDKHIGVEPISVNAPATLVGESGNVISQLNEAEMNVISGDVVRELRLRAKVAFEAPAAKNRNTFLRLKGATEYDVYLSTSLSAHSVQKTDKDGNKTVANDEFKSWETNIEFDPRKRIKGVSAVMHGALLDEAGQLIACTNAGFTRWLSAPADRLLAVKQLDLVAYETGGSVPPVTPSSNMAELEPQSHDSSVPEIDRPNDKGFTKLHYAAMTGTLDATKKLIADGANINAPQRTYGGTPLQYAASRGSFSIVNALIEAGAIVDSKDSSGRTPLYWAVNKNQPRAAVLLLKAGADPLDQKVQSALKGLKAAESQELLEAFDEHFARLPSAQWLSQQVTGLKLNAESNDKTLKLKAGSDPALQFPPNAKDDDVYGRFDVWTSGQIPFAVSTYIIQKNNKLLRSFALLREAPVVAFARDKSIWQPTKRSNAWHAVPNAAPVSEYGDERSAQMKAIAKRFSMAGRTLSLDPVASFVDYVHFGYKIEGSVFVFLNNNSVPHAVLTVEAYGKPNEKWEWRYTVARMTAPPGSIQLDSKTVLEWTGYWNSPRSSNNDFVEQKIDMP